MPGSKHRIAGIVLLLGMAGAMPAAAQSSFEEYRRQQREEFARYRQQRQTEFEQYRSRLNAEFARRLSDRWDRYEATPGRKRPEMPGPDKPIASDGSIPSTATPVKAGPVRQAEPTRTPELPVSAQTDNARDKGLDVKFHFFHTPCAVNSLQPPRVTADKQGISAAWQQLSDNPEAEKLVNRCLTLRTSLNLCDWAYLLLLGQVSSITSPSDANTAALLHTWLLCQSGFDALPGIGDGRIYMAFRPAQTIYEQSSYAVGGKAYYPHNRPDGGVRAFYSVPMGFRPDAVPLNMVMDRVPRLTPGGSHAPAYSSSSWTKAPAFNVTPNPSLIEFLQEYPLLDWQLYGSSALSPEVHCSLMQALGAIVDGMTPLEAINTLLDYTQQGFRYMTDGQQFGVEKPFFIEENFHHPFNDCEDRAILFARLTHELLGLDVVYLHYPRHLCTAVKVPGITAGNYVTVDGGRYWICDPCYVPSSAGMLAPPYQGVTPEVIRISMP